MASLDLVEPLNPRVAFCGGRTNVVKLYHLADIASREKIKYYDFTSLYPFINKNAEYPVGHPEIIFQPEDTNIQNYFGIAKVKILPPEKLFHPVLPLCENSKDCGIFLKRGLFEYMVKNYRVGKLLVRSCRQ